MNSQKWAVRQYTKIYLCLKVRDTTLELILLKVSTISFESIVETITELKYARKPFIGVRALQLIKEVTNFSLILVEYFSFVLTRLNSLVSMQVLPVHYCRDSLLLFRSDS